MKKSLGGRLLPVLLASGLAAAGCSGSGDSGTAGENDAMTSKPEMSAAKPGSVDQGRWVLTRVGGKAPGGGSTGWLEVDLAGQRITGNAGCNNFFASFEGSADAMTMGPVGGTKKMCPGEAMVLETAVYAVLAGVTRMYVNDEGQLVLEGKTGNLLASAAR
ncbi:MAG: META domain-containing protein [Pseudomonadota bacterium]